MHWQKIAEQILAIQDAAEESNRIVMLNLLGYRSLIPVTSKKKNCLMQLTWPMVHKVCIFVIFWHDIHIVTPYIQLSIFVLCTYMNSAVK